jgi:hypothetical protein
MVLVNLYCPIKGGSRTRTAGSAASGGTAIRSQQRRIQSKTLEGR